jgi:cytochrome c oxidase subunit 2
MTTFIRNPMRLMLMALALLAGCAGSAQFAAVPAGLDLDHVPKQTIQVTAERFRFIPDVIKVKQGTLVTLNITATEGEHGFRLSAFGIDKEIEEHESVLVQFYAAKLGEYSFRCSHFCGIGHLGMTGEIIVE